MVKLKVPEGVTHVTGDRDVIRPVNGVVEVSEEHAQSLRRAGFVDLDAEQAPATQEAANLAGLAESESLAGLSAGPDDQNAPTNDLSTSAETTCDALQEDTHDNESQGKNKKGKK